MTDRIATKLAELGLTLPEAAAPVAAYVAAVEAGGLLHISGQISFAADGTIMTGRAGEDRDLDYAKAAAERCGLMLVAQMKKALGTDGKNRKNVLYVDMRSYDKRVLGMPFLAETVDAEVRRCKAERAEDTATLVAQDVTKHVFHHHHIKLPRVQAQCRRGSIDKDMPDLDIGVFNGHFVEDFVP